MSEEIKFSKGTAFKFGFFAGLGMFAAYLAVLAPLLLIVALGSK